MAVQAMSRVEEILGADAADLLQFKSKVSRE
jgi:hypothetical protein